MSESKHTPGPWKVIKPGHHHAGKTRYRCVQIGKDENYSTLEMLPADAERIVACVNSCEGIDPKAVPDLLAACKLWDEGFTDGAEFSEDKFLAWVNANRRAARAAISKAEGRS